MSASALARSGPLVPALARSALVAWASTRPAGYFGLAPDGLPFVKAETLVERCGLAKAEPLPKKIDAAVAMLVRLGEERAEQAVRGGHLHKAERLDCPDCGNRGKKHVCRDGFERWLQDGVWWNAAGPVGKHIEKAEPKTADTFADLRARATQLGQNARKTDDPKPHRDAALHFRRAADTAKQQSRKDDAGYLESEASYHESRALNASSLKPSKTKKAEPTPHEAPDRGGVAKPQAPVLATPPQPVAPPTVRPPKTSKPTLEFSKSEASTLRCRRCGLGYFELSKAQRPEFTGCLCHSELAKSATVQQDGDRVMLELDLEPARAQCLLAEMKRVTRG